ncbi:MAG TPA: acyloxyacyl hydrolase [Burkholderiales bacterium]|nr:acyloxyacyl hydrolase [Burkholderiales bacterium]
MFQGIVLASIGNDAPAGSGETAEGGADRRARPAIGRLLIIAGVALLATTSAPLTAQGLLVEAGHGNGVYVVGLGLESPVLLSSRADGVAVSLDFLGRIDRWRGHDAQGGNDGLWDASAMPIARYEVALRPGLDAYIQTGIGVHLLSQTQIDDRRLSTAFQFGELLGAGVRLGERAQYDLGVTLQHVSNGGIKRPNNGLTFSALALRYWF